MPTLAPRTSLLAAAGFLAALVLAGAAWLRLQPPGAPGANAPDQADSAAVCFTPPQDCTSAIVREIRAARRSVLVQAYTFTSTPIAEALEAAHRRGVAVQVILDSGALGEHAGVARRLAAAGIPVFVDDPVGIAHNKVMVLDESTVITGSFNFTRSAEDRNAENLLILHDPSVAAAYAANWERRRRASVPYDPAARAPVTVGG
jgi:phosphatidylserine/phosphatidylglycerophosphate/cardiolipin synthase-like enzyme